MKTKSPSPKAKAQPQKKRVARKATPHKKKTLELTCPLGLEGWSDLDPVILASLATEEPLLLIGKHGTAKSFLLERLASALDLEFRFYNASLINYDDLVGFPIPDESNSSLRYISTPSSIWDAEVVFLDEINRTRPELQNKLFPIVHEKRVQGTKLDNLKFRWAAMNPPPDPDSEDEEEYLGAEPLDPALADRFSFILTVPSWGELKKASKRRVLIDQYEGEHAFAVSPAELVEKARKAYIALKVSPPPQLAEYIIAFESHYSKIGGYLSTRRLTNLHRNILAIQAARIAIGVDGLSSPVSKQEFGDWEESAYLALLHSLPQTIATGRAGQAKLLALHKQAWEIAKLEDADAWKKILQTNDPLQRLVLANGLRDKLGDFDLGKVILEALSAQSSQGEKSAVALASYLAFSRERDIPGTVVETLALELKEVLDPNEVTRAVSVGTARTVQKAASILTTLSRSGDKGNPSHVFKGYVRNLLYSGNYQNEDTPESRFKFFQKLWTDLDLDNVKLTKPSPWQETN